MKLKVIFFCFTALTLLTAAAGLYFYFESKKSIAYNEDILVSNSHLKSIEQSFSQLILSHQAIPLSLARHHELIIPLTQQSPENLNRANQILDLYNFSFNTSVCYLMNTDGITIASSNRNDKDSFIGQNYSFRPYFKNAAQGKPTVYMAKGVTSGKRGIFFSNPVHDDAGILTGVVVIKEDIKKLEKNILSEHYPTHLKHDDFSFIIDENGVIFLTDHPAMLFHTLFEVDQREKERIASLNQFGNSPLPWSGLKATGKETVIDQSGKHYILILNDIEQLPGWKVVHLSNFDAISERVASSFFKTAGSILFFISLVLGSALLILNWLAMEAEKSLKSSQERYQTVTETVNEGIILQAASGEILTWNKGAETIFGIPAKEAVSQRSNSYNWPTIREDGSKYEGKDHPSIRTLQTGKPSKNEIMGVYQPSGDLRWISINTNPMYRPHEDKPYAVAISFADITEIKRGKDQSQMYLEATTDGIWTWNFQTNALFFSPKYYKMLGYAPDAFPSDFDHWMDLIHPDDREKSLAVVSEYLRTKPDKYENEFRLRTADGKYRWIRARAKVAVKDADGEPVIMVGNHEDITERKKIEEALIESERRWRNILVNVPQIGITLDLEANIIFANEHFLKLTGWKKQEVIGQDWFDMFIPENVREVVRNIFHTVMSQEDMHGFSTYENEIIDKFENLINVAWSNVMTKDVEGNVLDVTCLGVDLTERKRSEEALKKSEAKYRKMMEAIKDPVYISSRDRRLQYTNTAMVERVGYDASGESCYAALHGLDDICPWCEQDTVFREGYSEKNIVSPNDNRSFHVSSSAFTNENGSISKISVLRDTTEFKLMQSRLQQAQKMEAIGTLAGGIAHDFNNILFPILGHAEMLLEDIPEENSSIRNSLNEIYTGSLRARELVHQILAFAHQGPSILKLMKMQPIIKEALKLIRATIPTTISINQNLQSDCGAVKADPTQIHQIVMNLTTNAYHAMEENGGELKVTFKEIHLDEHELITLDMRPGTYACLTVADTGAGMDKNTMHKIFDPFFTTKGKGKGTGMGLSVVHGIVKSMNGEIQVYSEPGRGSQFHIYLPIVKSAYENQEIQTNEPIQGGTESVLLVDDEEGIIAMEKQALERLGYHVASRTSSLEALEAFRASPDKFELVITDKTMPKMPGDKLAVELMKIRPDIPILLCTGFSESMSEEKIKSLGIRGLLLKPIIIKDLAKKIREILDGNENV